MNNILHNKHAVFGLVGDFWHRQLDETASGGVGFARAVSHLVDATTAVGELRSAAQLFSGSYSNYKDNVTVRFNPVDVRILNINLQQRTVTGTYPNLTITKPGKYTAYRTGAMQVENLPGSGDPESEEVPYSYVLGDDDTGNVFYSVLDRDVTFTSEEARLLYFVKIPYGISPTVIIARDKELTVGTSFITNANGYILFFDNPIQLFPDNQIVMRSALVRHSHIMDYTYQTDFVYSYGTYIARYMRYTHSPSALKLALAEVAGLPIIHQDSILLSTYDTADAVIYEFDKQVVTVPKYINHDALVVGTTYSAGTIIGDSYGYISVYSAASTAGSTATPWYRTSELATEWTANGLPLTSLTPFTSVVVPDATGTFSANGATSGATAHLKISGVTGAGITGYWDFVRQSEIHTNKYLAGISGVTAGATANAVDFYFANMLDYNSVVIRLQTTELGSERHNNVMSFIRRDLPINVTPIILSFTNS